MVFNWGRSISKVNCLYVKASIAFCLLTTLSLSSNALTIPLVDTVQMYNFDNTGVEIADSYCCAVQSTWIANSNGGFFSAERQSAFFFDIANSPLITNSILQVSIDFNSYNDFNFPGATISYSVFGTNDLGGGPFWDTGDLVMSFVESAGSYPLEHKLFGEMDISALVKETFAAGYSYLGINARMNPVFTGVNPVAYTTVAISVPIDTANPIPEPETYALLLVGLAALGSISKYSRDKRSKTLNDVGF